MLASIAPGFLGHRRKGGLTLASSLSVPGGAKPEIVKSHVRMTHPSMVGVGPVG